MGKKVGPAQPMLEPSKPRHQEGRKLYQYIATFVVGIMTAQAGMALSWSSPALPHLKATSFGGTPEENPLANTTGVQRSLMELFPNITEKQISGLKSTPIVTKEQIVMNGSRSTSSQDITTEQESWIKSTLNVTEEQAARLKPFLDVTEEQGSWTQSIFNMTKEQRSWTELFLNITAELRTRAETSRNVTETQNFSPNITKEQILWLQSTLNTTRVQKISGITEEQGSWITSLMAIGAFVGAVPAGKVADKIGRKRALLSLIVPILLSWVMIILAKDLSTLYVARFISGIGAGAVCVLAPMYTGEIAEASVRGALGASFALLFDFGILYSYVAGALLSYIAFNISCAIMVVPFIAVFPFMPESPMWLVHQGRKGDANRALEVLRGPNYDTKAEVSVLQEEADEHENRKGGFRDLIGTLGGRKAMITSIGLMIFQQLSGIDAMIAYAEEIFADASSSIEPKYSSIIAGIIHVFMAVVTALIIDRAGRRPLLLFSGTVTSICLGILGFYFYRKTNDYDIHGITWLPLATFAVYNMSFAIGFGDIPWMIVSELFPPETKGVATSIAIMVNWALVFAVTKFFPIMNMSLGPANTYWILGIFMALAAVFVFFVVPETKGKTLQEIQEELNGEMPAIPLKTFETIS